MGSEVSLKCGFFEDRSHSVPSYQDKNVIIGRILMSFVLIAVMTNASDNDDE